MGTSSRPRGTRELDAGGSGGQTKSCTWRGGRILPATPASDITSTIQCVVEFALELPRSFDRKRGVQRLHSTCKQKNYTVEHLQIVAAVSKAKDRLRVVPIQQHSNTYDRRKHLTALRGGRGGERKSKTSDIFDLGKLFHICGMSRLVEAGSSHYGVRKSVLDGHSVPPKQ